MFATLEFIAGVALLFIATVSFWLARPGRPFNSWLVKHSIVESMFPLFLISTIALAVAAFVNFLV